ncbi:acyl-CoA thioesterase II [Nakamurella flavida]|uniref:Acyl-CoA thioesterase 2 n=1 Tax=Nakamurella flavida TaxID=363630 RepID=A0A939C4Q5_9ACTN|nr:acyl-CoA thioesterase II [Nakamurella flavida]
MQRDVDGVPRGQLVLDGLLQLLALQQLGEDLFRGVSPERSPVRVFGGQVAAQALTAAGRTVGADRPVHSLHGYFVRAGDPRIPIDYQVERIRDGRSFTTRRVTALQGEQVIFTMAASFQVREVGVDHATAAPVTPDPESLPTYAERVAPFQDQLSGWGRFPRPFDVRYVNDPPWQSRLAGPRPGLRNQVWFRPDGVVPDDDLVHVCLLAYLSDLTLLDSLLASHALTHGTDQLQLASLDHAMWFHRPVRLDDWVLYDTESPSAAGGRGLVTGRFFARDGAMMATVVQEGLIRIR